MAYVSIESDERMEEGPEGLQFQSFLGSDSRATNDEGGPAGNVSRGYRQDAGNKSGSWTFEYFQPYFDVDTRIVLRRCYMTMFPPSATSYQGTCLSPAADLYGPFWTLTSLIFALFVCSSLSSAIASWLSNPNAAAHIVYDFSLIFTATSLVYSYGLVLPVLLWFGLRYLGVGEWSIVDAVAIWGYGQFVWIPVALLCIIPVAVVRWADAKSVRLIVILLAVLHAAIALSFKILFFSYYALQDIGPQDPTAGGKVP